MTHISAEAGKSKITGPTGKLETQAGIDAAFFIFLKIYF